MSQRTPKYIDPDAWRIINATIRRYPRMYAELVEGEIDVIFGRREVGPGAKNSSQISDPTAAKAMVLSSRRRSEMHRKCEAVSACLLPMKPEYRRVVCLRYWGVENMQTALAIAREGEELHGMRFESIRTPETASRKGGYSQTQARRIVRGFVYSVGVELGEI